MSDPRRDEALEAAWRAQSQEQPPPSLDAAILATARREVHARPEALGRSQSTAQARNWLERDRFRLNQCRSNSL